MTKYRDLHFEEGVPGVTNCQTLILKQTKTTRLLFCPMIVDKIGADSPGVKGKFVHQRRGSTHEEWSDIEGFSLATLKKNQAVNLELKSEAVQNLILRLNQLQEVAEEYGRPRDHQRFIKIEDFAAYGFGSVDSDAINTVVEVLLDNDRGGQALLARIVQKLDRSADRKKTLEALDSVDAEQLSHLSSLAQIAALRNVLKLWEDSDGEESESHWQDFFGDHPILLDPLFPAAGRILFQGASLGGSGLSGKGDRKVDYLIEHSLLNSACIIEIKKPNTPLLGGKYRGNAYAPSTECVGAVTQLLDYREKLITRQRDRGSKAEMRLETWLPRSFLIIGSISQLEDEKKRRSFELYRRSLRFVEVVTFDELREKARGWLDVLDPPPNDESGNQSNTCGFDAFDDDEIPF